VAQVTGEHGMNWRKLYNEKRLNQASWIPRLQLVLGNLCGPCNWKNRLGDEGAHRD